MATTNHNEYGQLEEVYLKRPKDAVNDQASADTQWQALNYLHRPHLEQANQEYEAFCNILKEQGTSLNFFPKDPNVSMDSIYPRDASIITDFGVILCAMGKEQRLPEPTACQQQYLADGLRILGQIEAPGKVEGGDVAWLDQNTLAVGHGYRTNDEGYEQLSRILNPLGINLVQVDLPHYKGTQDVFHLMSIFSPVDKNKAVVYSPLMPVRFRNELLKRDYQLIEVPESEFESMGCNVLAVAPSKCLMVAGNPITKERLMAASCSVIEYQGKEISVNGGGGPTCLTRPSRRSI